MSQRLSKEKAIALRAKMKGKKPEFRRWESWRYTRVSDSWRKPDGIDSKARRRAKGWPQLVEVGYRGPRKARGLHPSGYKEVIVRNVDDLAKIDPETQAIRIGHAVGMKKRADISLRAGERHIHIVNPLPAVKPAEEVEGQEAKGTEVREETAAEGKGEEGKPELSEDAGENEIPEKQRTVDEKRSGEGQTS